jgi:Trk-type K+ transport system membrane component
LRNLLPSLVFILSITLPNIPFPALLSTLIRIQFQVKKEYYGTRYQVAPFPSFLWGVFFTTCTGGARKIIWDRYVLFLRWPP